MRSRPPADTPCALCSRVAALQFHHLIPRKVHRRNHYRRHYTKAQLADGVYLCRPCHRAIHRFFDEMTLAKEMNSVDKLASAPEVQRHVSWVRKQRVAE